MDAQLVVGAVAVLASSLSTVAGAIWYVRVRETRAADPVQALRKLLLDREAGALTSEEFECRQARLHAALLNSPRRLGTLVLVGSAVAIAAVAVYLLAGRTEKPQSPGAVSSSQRVVGASAAGAWASMTRQAAAGAGDLRAMVVRLAERLAREPSDGEGWILLGKAYIELGQHSEAVAAFEKGIALVPSDAALLADYADARVVANSGQWDDKSRTAVTRALAIDSRQVKAIALAGTEAHERKDYQAAAAFWERMKDAAAPGSVEAQQAGSNLAEARTLMSGAAPARPSAAGALPAGGEGVR